MAGLLPRDDGAKGVKVLLGGINIGLRTLRCLLKLADLSLVPAISCRLWPTVSTRIWAPKMPLTALTA